MRIGRESLQLAWHAHTKILGTQGQKDLWKSIGWNEMSRTPHDVRISKLPCEAATPRSHSQSAATARTFACSHETQSHAPRGGKLSGGRKQ